MWFMTSLDMYLENNICFAKFKNRAKEVSIRKQHMLLREMFRLHKKKDFDISICMLHML